MSTDNKEHVIYFESGKYTVRADETVLDALLRQGVNVPFSCKGGVCQACMMRCVEGEVPERAQRGLVPEQQRRGCLLVCVCEPQTDMSLLRGTPEDHVTECMLHEHLWPERTVLSLSWHVPPYVATGSCVSPEGRLSRYGSQR